VDWPAGVGGKGNEGVASYVQQMDGSIGYVEYAYALQNKLNHVLLKNRDGQFTAPTMESFQAAAEGADWAHSAGFYVILVNQPGPNSWPITGASFIILYKQQAEMEGAKRMMTFFDWCYKHGKDIAGGLDYVPIPDNVVGIVEKVWSSEIKAAGKPIWP
jgi:phosphate transport system substrate-binding protein